MKVFVCVFAFFGCASAGRFFMSFGDKTCEPPLGDECIPITNCKFFTELLNKTPIPRPRGVISIIKKHHCGFYDNAPKVCCNRPPTTTSTTTSTPRSSRQEKREQDDSFEEEEDLVTQKYYDLLPNNICGISQTAPDFRITSGTKTVVGEFPWMALIAYATDDPQDSLDFRCGGTVFHERYVLTAAHCILNTSIVGVRLGEHDLTTEIDCEKDYCAPLPQDFFVEDLIVHPQYNPKTFANDIAIIKLATPANFTHPNVRPVCLPLTDTVETNGKNGIICGWGVTEYGHKSPVLLKASVPLLPLARCRRLYRRFAPVGPRQVCAGGRGGRDSCGGDSGGPLHAVEGRGGAPRHVQRGVVSFGPRVCGADGRPAVYTSVAGHLGWILDVVAGGGD